MDGAYSEIANRFSIGKAIVSASTGLPSGEVEGAVDHPAGAGVFGQGMPVIRIRGDCRSSETGKSRARAALAEQYPTSKRKSAPAPGLPASYADARGRPFVGRAAKKNRSGHVFTSASSAAVAARNTPKRAAPAVSPLKGEFEGKSDLLPRFPPY